MRKMRKTFLVTIVLASFAGCAGNRELLNTPLPQSYFLPNPPDRVWNAALLEAAKPNRRILARDESTHLLSWLSEIESDVRLHSSLTDVKIASGGTDVTVIAVLRVEPVPGGSKLTARLTYVSARGFHRVSASRGNYEQEILRSIKTSLIAETMSYDKH
jgi:hypothetical protein